MVETMCGPVSLTVYFGGRILAKMMSDDADIGQRIGSLEWRRQSGPHTNMWGGP